MPFSIKDFFRPNSKNTEPPPKPSPQPPPPSSTQAPPQSSSSLDILSSSQFESQELKSSGKTVIKSSDDEDSDSSIEELDVVLGITRPKPQYIPENLSQGGPSHFTYITKKAPTDIKKAQTHKSNPLVAAVLKRRREEQEKSARIDEQRQQLRLASPEPAAEEAKDGESILRRANDILGSFLPADPDVDENAASRDLVGAIRRVEAHKQNPAWYFFKNDKDATWENEVNFPRDICGSRPDWEERLTNDPTLRHDGGLPRDPSEYTTLEDQQARNRLVSWMLIELCFEHNDRLRDAYFQAITSRLCFLKQGWPELVDQIFCAETISCFFQKMGGTKEALALNGPIKLGIEDESRFPSRDWGSLCAVVQLIGDASPYVSNDTRRFALTTLCRLSIDSEMALDANALYRLEIAMSRLIASFPENDASACLQSVGRQLLATIKDPSCFAKLLMGLPSVSAFTGETEGTEMSLLRASSFRRSLALAYFLSSETLISHVSLPKLTDRLQQPSFAIRQAADYTWIHSLICILEFALDDGSPPDPSDFKDDTESLLEAEKTFNNQIDSLAEHIKHMSGKIQDAGAMHMARTETKDALDRLYFRLIFAMRTKPKAKRMMFDSDTHAKGALFGQAQPTVQKQADFMSGFLASSKGLKRDAEGEVRKSS